VPERRAAPAPRRPPATAPDRAPIPAASPAFTSTLPVSADTPPLAATVIDTLPLPAAPVTRIELTVEADSVIGVRIENPVSSATARVEDPVSAIVSRDVVERGGKFREKARISLLFTTLVLSPAERIPIVTEAIHRDGDSPTAEATTKIGAGAVVGGVLGAIIGGKKGAAIGGAAGAAGGTAAVAAGGQNDAVLAGGALLTLRLLEPVVIAVDREP
jgi:hypothetical protein